MKKFYVLPADRLASAVAGKTPRQQVQILTAMSTIGRPATGTEIIAHAIENHGLVTRQRYDVLYAWYARDNERRGVKQVSESITLNVPMIEDTRLIK
jgi:hypothetical protein